MTTNAQILALRLLAEKSAGAAGRYYRLSHRQARSSMILTLIALIPASAAVLTGSGYALALAICLLAVALGFGATSYLNERHAEALRAEANAYTDTIRRHYGLQTR